jgi:hypothetical protein
VTSSFVSAWCLALKTTLNIVVVGASALVRHRKEVGLFLYKTFSLIPLYGISLTSNIKPPFSSAHGMSFLITVLCFLIVPPFSSATHSFDHLREQGLYPATTYNNSITNEIPISGGLNNNFHWVPENLQPEPHSNPSRSSIGPYFWTAILCSNNALPTPDCKAAISLIPTGHLILDPRTTETLGTRPSQTHARFNFHLPRPLRKFFLPAAFQSGKCVIYIKDEHVNFQPEPNVELPPQYNAAAFMYHTVWPNSRRLAELIIQRCGSRGGYTIAKSAPEGRRRFRKLAYRVFVGGPEWNGRMQRPFNTYSE